MLADGIHTLLCSTDRIDGEKAFGIWEQLTAKLDGLLAEERLRELALTSLRVGLQRQNAEYFAAQLDTSPADRLKALYAVNKPEDEEIGRVV